MIRTWLLAILILGASSVKAQRGCPAPFGVQNEIKRYHIAAGVGLTSLYGDIDKSGTLRRAFYIKGDYQIKKGLYVGLEGQYGSLEALTDLNDRQVDNTYFGGGLMLTFHPFEFFVNRNYSSQSQFVNRIADAFYVGIGMMGIISKYDVFQDVSIPSTYGPIERYDKDTGEAMFRKKSSLYTKPTINTGFAFPINRTYSRAGSYWSVLLNGQFNFTNNDLLDGYTPRDANLDRIGTGNDMYSFYTVGARYSF